MCRKKDVIKHRCNQMSVTGTEYILIILGQKVKLEPKVAKIVLKMLLVISGSLILVTTGILGLSR